MYLRGLVTLLLVMLLLSSGCYSKPSYTPPEIYPVTGKLVDPSGKIPAGSSIKFIPKQGEHLAEGTLQEDGSFTLKTLFHEEWLPGGVEGEYVRAEILVPIGLGPLGGKIIKHNETFIIEPKENNFLVTIK